ncbi:MAG: IPT/TIG domain-containing protein [Myxococcales bacterium]
MVAARGNHVGLCNGIDSTINVQGTGFRPEDGEGVQLLDANGNVVLEGAAKDIRVLSATSLTLFVHGASSTGALAPGTYTIRVFGKEGPPACTGTSAAGVLEVVPPPIISSVQPAATCTEVSLEVVLRGTGFRQGATVQIGTSSAKTVTVVSATEIHASFDPRTLPAGQWPVTVTNPELGDGVTHCSGNSSSTFTVYAPPTLRSVSPTTACSGGGQTITASGTGFHGAMQVALALTSSSTVSSTPATGVQVPSDTSLTFGDGFEAGQTIALQGAKAGDSDLLLADLTVVNANVIRATVPAGAVAGGPYALVLIAPSGCGATLAAAYTVDATAQLTVSKIVPPFGWQGDKTPVSVFGDGFAAVPRVFLDVPSSTPRLVPTRSTGFVTAQSLTGIVPAGLLVGGPYQVVVINPDGGGGKQVPSIRAR